MVEGGGGFIQLERRRGMVAVVVMLGRG